jgi:GntR family transcriptional regulator
MSSHSDAPSESRAAPTGRAGEGPRPRAQGLTGAASGPAAKAAPPSSPAFSPLYQQIRALMVQSLQQGLWGPGDVIPSEQELAQRYKVSQGTVRKAIDDLVVDHLLVRRQGKGTFVATHAEARSQYRFLRLSPDDGRPQRAQRRVIDCLSLRAPADVAHALGIRAGQAVFRVRRVLSFGEPAASQAIVWDDIWLPGAAFKGLSAERLAAYQGPMYALFESEFGVHMLRAEEKIRAVAAEAEVALELGVPAGSPLLSVERLSFTWGDKPMELRRGLYRTDSFHYRNALN